MAGAPGRRALRSLPRMAWSRPDILLASLTINILSLALPLVILQAYDRIIPNRATDTLVLLTVGLAVVLVLDAGLRMIRSYLNIWSAARFEHAAGCRAAERLLATDLATFEAVAPGTQLDRLNAIEPLRDFYSGQGLMAVVDLPFVVVFIALIALIGGPLAAIPVLLLGLMVASAGWLGRRLRAALQRRSVLDDRRFNFIIEVLSGIHTVKGLALEALMARRYERLQESTAEAGYGVSRLAQLAQAQGVVFSNLTMVLVAGAGSLIVLDGGMTVGMLAACILLAGRSVQPVLRAVGLWTQFQGIRVAEQRFGEVMALPVEAPATRPPMPPIGGGVTLEGITHVPQGAEQPLFQDLELKVAAGETLAILGESGCGKSTLFPIILGLQRPDAGRVRFDGVDAALYDPRSIRAQIGYLPQNGVLFRGTILDNLTMFRGHAYLDAAMALSRSLGLDEVLARLPNGLETRVGDAAFEALPGGVQQRIAIIRALVGQPRLILFDEANTSFDARTDKLLRRLLEEIGRHATVILVSHRPSLTSLAERVVRIQDRRLVPVAAPQPPAHGRGVTGPGRNVRRQRQARA